jgi:ribose 5-phosphate isomerase B
MRKRLSIGSDHAGFGLKGILTNHIGEAGWEVHDVGTHSDSSMDYPDPAHAVALAVASKESDFGILICGSGNGVSMAANRHPGVRCALAWNTEIAELGRLHNNANVLAIPARFVTAPMAMAMVDAFLRTGFEGGRHQRRIEKIETS